MSNTFSSTPDVDPQSGSTDPDRPNASVAQAAKELREAAGERLHGAVHQAEEKFRESLHKAKEKSSELRGRAGESARQLCEAAEEKANELRQQAQVHAKQLHQTACEQWDETRVKAREIQVTAEDYIRQNPAKCVLSAVGIGFLIGLLVRR